MPATDPQTLFSNANVACYANSNPGDWALYQLALLQQIAQALNPMAATDPQSLLASASCYNCSGNWGLLQLALLQIIANAITGGGPTPNPLQQVYTGSYQNPSIGGIFPVNPLKSAIYYQDPSFGGTGTDVWMWSLGNQAWFQFSV